MAAHVFWHKFITRCGENSYGNRRSPRQTLAQSLPESRAQAAFRAALLTELGETRLPNSAFAGTLNTLNSAQPGSSGLPSRRCRECPPASRPQPPHRPQGRHRNAAATATPRAAPAYRVAHSFKRWDSRRPAPLYRERAELACMHQLSTRSSRANAVLSRRRRQGWIEATNSPRSA